MFLLCALSQAGMASDRGIAVAGDATALTVLANDASLREIIEHIALHQQLSVESHTDLNEHISAEFSAQPLPRVLKRLLRDYNFTLQTGGSRAPRSTGVSGKLWIFPRHPHAADLNREVDRFGKRMPDNLQWAMQRVASRDDAERLEAVAVLTAFGGDESFSTLAAAVYDADPRVRTEAVAGLGQSQDPAALALLEQSLLDHNLGVRSSAVQSLAERVEAGDTAALALLAVPLRDPAKGLRAATVDLLADLEGAEAAALLRQALADQSPEISAAAAEYLAER